MVETDLMIYCIIAFFLGYYLNNICSRPNYENFSLWKTDKCSIDEANNSGGSNRCTNDSHCQGDRVCGKLWAEDAGAGVLGWCRGESNC